MTDQQIAKSAPPVAQCEFRLNRGKDGVLKVFVKTSQEFADCLSARCATYVATVVTETETGRSEMNRIFFNPDRLTSEVNFGGYERWHPVRMILAKGTQEGVTFVINRPIPRQELRECISQVETFLRKIQDEYLRPFEGSVMVNILDRGTKTAEAK